MVLGGGALASLDGGHGGQPARAHVRVVRDRTGHERLDSSTRPIRAMRIAMDEERELRGVACRYRFKVRLAGSDGQMTSSYRRGATAAGVLLILLSVPREPRTALEGWRTRVVP